jgi:hypothetical protein
MKYNVDVLETEKGKYTAEIKGSEVIVADGTIANADGTNDQNGGRKHGGKHVKSHRKRKGKGKGRRKSKRNSFVIYP